MLMVTKIPNSKTIRSDSKTEKYFSAVHDRECDIVVTSSIMKLTENGYVWLVFSTADCETNSFGL